MKLIFSNGLKTQEITIYPSKKEAGKESVKLFENGYASIGPVDHKLASKCFLEINGIKKSVLIHKEEAIEPEQPIPYKEELFTFEGYFLFKVPERVTKLKIAVCGGGGGATCVNSIIKESSGSNGEASSFGNVTANGGTGGSTGFFVGTAGEGGKPNGRNGFTGTSRGIGEGGEGFDAKLAITSGTYGKGGNYNLTSSGRGSSGGSGAFVTQNITVTPGQEIDGMVGKGGTQGLKTGGTAENGNSGFVLIAYGGDII